MMPRALVVTLVVAVLLAGGCAGSSKRGDAFAARKALARELTVREDWAAAFATIAELHRDQPRDAEVLVMRGIVYRERGLELEAETDLQQAIALDDDLPDAHAALGILLDVTRRGDKAEPHHRRAVSLAPRNPVYLNNLGFSLFLRGKHREAIATYQDAARLSPSGRRLRTNLGFAYAASGDLPRAAREFEMGGTPAEARNNLGFAYEQKGDLARAFDLYLEAARLDPASSRTRKNLLHVAKALGKEVPADVTIEPGQQMGKDGKP